MTIVKTILDYAMNRYVPFKRKELLDYIGTSIPDASYSSVEVQINRLVAEKRLTRVDRGLYEYPQGAKREFVYAIDDKMMTLGKAVRQHFPYIEFCVWCPSVLSQFMRHIPFSEMTLVDVEKDAMEAVFRFIQDNFAVPALLSPSKRDCDRYITHREQIIIRPLIQEAPLDQSDFCPVPTLEKMLVDAVSDNELQFLQGAELFTIYETALSGYAVNTRRLLRYASRRNRKEQIEHILQSINA